MGSAASPPRDGGAAGRGQGAFAAAAPLNEPGAAPQVFTPTPRWAGPRPGATAAPSAVGGRPARARQPEVDAVPRGTAPGQLRAPGPAWPAHANAGPLLLGAVAVSVVALGLFYRYGTRGQRRSSRAGCPWVGTRLSGDLLQRPGRRLSQTQQAARRAARPAQRTL